VRYDNDVGCSCGQIRIYVDYGSLVRRVDGAKGHRSEKAPKDSTLHKQGSFMYLQNIVLFTVWTADTVKGSH